MNTPGATETTTEEALVMLLGLSDELTAFERELKYCCAPVLPRPKNLYITRRGELSKWAWILDVECVKHYHFSEDLLPVRSGARLRLDYLGGFQYLHALNINLFFRQLLEEKLIIVSDIPDFISDVRKAMEFIRQWMFLQAELSLQEMDKEGLVATLKDCLHRMRLDNNSYESLFSTKQKDDKKFMRIRQFLQEISSDLESTKSFVKSKRIAEIRERIQRELAHL